MQPKKTRSRMAPAERKMAIIAAARAHLRDVGYEDFLPTEVARRCGVSEATIYHYFDTKHHLLIEACEQWMHEILSSIPQLGEIDDLYARLRHSIFFSMSAVQQEPTLTRFIFLALRSDTKYKSTTIFSLNQKITRLVRGVLQSAVEQGVFHPSISTRLLRDMIFGVIEHQTWDFVRHKGDFPVESTVDAITRIIWNGALDHSNSDNKPV